MKQKIFFLGLAALLIFSSCQKVITIDLNKTNPQLVVDGQITDQPGPYIVKLTETTDFFTPGAYPQIKGAIVTITDLQGITETLQNMDNGTYQTAKLSGTPGHTYVLNISYGGKSYTATSSMPMPVDIDSMTYGWDLSGRRPRLTLHGYFTDPQGINNYYRMHFLRNDSLMDSSNFLIYSDDKVDGKQAVINYRRGINIGDSITLQLMCIDKGVYDFYRTANDILGRSQITSAAPSNPLSNMSAGAVGCFTAYTIRQKKILLQ